VVSVYARGRDYHKVLRQRLQRLADDLQAWLGPMGHRVFCDSAPVLEVELAQHSGLVWRGKHTLGLHREGGSMFFLGEIYVDVALPPTTAVAEHCGRCSACIDVCPTGAIVAPYRLDARRCISYLTIEHEGPIDEALRPLIGNHVYGCDDCQLACPWNKYAQRADLPDFAPKADFDPAAQPDTGEALLRWLSWSEERFLHKTEGSAIRRIGHERWLRNVALVAGNALRDARLSDALRQHLQAALQQWAQHESDTVREQVAWSLAQSPNP
jgi:epoxyqueuosine reductase